MNECYNVIMETNDIGRRGMSERERKRKRRMFRHSLTDRMEKKAKTTYIHEKTTIQNQGDSGKGMGKG